MRNITLTGPYGHDGVYRDLEAMLRHHLDPVNSLYAYDLTMVTLPDFNSQSDFAILAQPRELAAIATANELEPQHLSDEEISNLLSFLNALTDLPAAIGQLSIPDSVPSGLPIDR